MKKAIRCGCHAHMLVLDQADWDCAGDDSEWATLDITMWEPVPERNLRPWYRDLFWLPRYTWKLRELWKTWKGERYAEWVVLDLAGVKELQEYLDSLVGRADLTIRFVESDPATPYHIMCGDRVVTKCNSLERTDR